MTELTPEQSSRVRALDSTLRLIGRIGQFLLTVTVIAFAVMGVLWPDPYANIWSLVLAHIVGGRPGNVLLGLNMEFPPLFIYIQCVLEDYIILFLFYPLLVAGYRHAVEWRILGPTLVSIRQSADRHKSKVEPFGVAGLMIFVIFPFWSTGALVGAFVGYLIGMRTVVAFASVIVGNLVAVALWVWFFDRLDQFSSRLTTHLLIGIFATVIVAALVAQFRRNIHTRRAHIAEETKSDSGTDGATSDPEGEAGGVAPDREDDPISPA